MRFPLLLPCLLLITGSAAAQQRARMPRGAFLAAPVCNTAELLRQFDSHPHVAQRYMRALGRSREEVRLLLSHLSPQRLLAPYQGPVGFFLAGNWSRRVQALPIGTLVFVTPDGRPFLKENCGNPLLILPTRPLVSRPRIEVPILLEMPQFTLDLPPRLDVPSSTLTPPEFYTPPITSIESADLPLLSPAYDLSLSPTESPAYLEVPGIPLRRGGDWAWGLLLLPLFFLNGGDGGRNGPGGPGVIGPSPIDVIPPANVPEPGAWAFLAAAGTLGVVWCGRRPRNRGL